MKCKKCGAEIEKRELLNEAANALSEYATAMLKEIFCDLARKMEIAEKVEASFGDLTLPKTPKKYKIGVVK